MGLSTKPAQGQGMVGGLWWAPQPGPQAEAATCPADEIMFGGTRGGGKTDTAIGRQCRGAQKYGHQWNGLMIRRKYKDFAEIRRRFDELIRLGMPAERVGGDNQVNVVRWDNGATVTLVAILRMDQLEDYLGQQYTEVTIEEAPSIPFLGQLVDRIKGSTRSPHGVPCHIFLTGNPGGPGSGQVRIMYIDPVDEGAINRITSESDDGTKSVTTRIFIRSTLSDNQILCENDPTYVNRIRSISDPALRAAWLDGRWDVFVGQAFTFTPRHVIKPIWPIPEWAPIYMTMDWGFGAPFSIGWWWVDYEGRVIRFAEWYGWNKVTPNVGLRLTDKQLGWGILEREKGLGISNRPIIRLAGPDCFNKKPDYKGGGQGASTADEFVKMTGTAEVKAEFGKSVELNMLPGDPKRDIKIRQFRNRLEVPNDPDKLPMLVVYNTCRDFIRIIPSLCADDKTGEYLEEGQELHPFDEACHICMANKVDVQAGNNIKVLMAEVASKAKAEARQRLDNVSRAAMDELDAIINSVIESTGGTGGTGETGGVGVHHIN